MTLLTADAIRFYERALRSAFEQTYARCFVPSVDRWPKTFLPYFYVGCLR